MRLVLSLLVVGAIAAAWFGGRARADDAEPASPEVLKRRIDGLDLMVKYLSSREKALTLYVMENQDRAHNLSEQLKIARAQGFTAGAFSAPSREALLKGLEDMAKDLGRDLPEITREEKVMLDQASRLK
jgi:hypothetical protein